MENIILINELTTKSSKILFGYVGRSLETGRIKYYFFSNPGDVNSLQEFDINNIDNEYLYNCLNDCTFERPKFSSELPAELEEMLSLILDEHTKYNTQNGYPTDYIAMNRRDLSVQTLTMRGFLRTRSSSAQYDALENKIELSTTKDEWKTLSDAEKEKVKKRLIHEAGHLKATRLSLTGDILTIQAGFGMGRYNTSSVRLENGDILYLLGKGLPTSIVQSNIKEILEEVMNDYDCYCAFPGYQRNYPKFGEELNNLCDGKLVSFGRYNGGIDTYFDALCSIIPDSDLASELLERIYAATYDPFYRDVPEKLARQIVRRYEQEKHK